MSDYRIVAAVTHTLSNIVQQAIQQAVPEAKVRVGPPRPSAPGSGPEVSLYLYQISPNAALRNSDLPMRSAQGAIIRQPLVAVELHYLLSFFGEQDFASELMAGKVLNLFHVFPGIRAEEILRVADSNSFQNGSNGVKLGPEFETIEVTPEYLSIEELSKLWTVFFQMAHRLSLQYVATPVLVDADISPLQVPLARRREIEVLREASPPNGPPAAKAPGGKLNQRK